MTDISKYKSVALSHISCAKLDKIRKVIVPLYTNQRESENIKWQT
jgi:hypothetical protein